MVEEAIQTIEAGQFRKKQHYVEEWAFTARDLTEAFIQQREY